LGFETPACQDQLGSRGTEFRHWGVRIIECSSVELKVWLWREEFTCVIVPLYLEYLIQCECYSSCVKIRCQETDSGCCNILTLIFVALNCKARRLAIAL
jgi:hypothetical protein